MNCPIEVRDAILGIISVTLLRIVNSNNDNIKQCQIEAYHIHNLPDLIIHYNYDLLSYYWKNERTQFIRESLDRNFNSYEEYWAIFEKIIRHPPKS